MWSRLLTCTLLLLPVQALAGAKENVAALAPSGLVLVVDEKGNELIAQNIDKPFVPASVTKIVTAWLAMQVLGGDYRFETRFYNKTGTFSGVRTLAGYADTSSHGRVRFVISLNGNSGTLRFQLLHAIESGL